jgi:hypothetical protein
MRSSSILYFGVLTSLHRHNRGLSLLPRHWINCPWMGHRLTRKTTAAVVPSAGANYEEVADMTDSFVSRSVGGGKRT